MDTLADVLAAAAVSGSVAATVLAGGRWGLQLDEIPGAAFHAVAAGTLHLRVDDLPPVTLFPGDVVLLPSGAPHVISADAGSPIRPWLQVMQEAGAGPGDDVVVGESPVTTRILCASYRQDPSSTLTTYGLLPAVVHVPAVAATPALRSTVHMLGEELAHPGPGSRAVLDHVVNILLIHVMSWFIAQEAAATHPPSWLRGLADPVIAAALGHLHSDPSRAWTVDSLGRQVGVSRATLTRRFADEVGTSPSEYLTAWRMELAGRSLRTSDDAVASIAHRVGYTSEYAFNRAFARRHGIAPGRYRATTRHPPAPVAH